MPLKRIENPDTQWRVCQIDFLVAYGEKYFKSMQIIQIIFESTLKSRPNQSL